MKDLNIVDIETNSDNMVDESDIIVTLDPGGVSGSSTPPLETSKKNSNEKNAFSNDSVCGDEVTSLSQFPPPPIVKTSNLTIENKGEKEKDSHSPVNRLTNTNVKNNTPVEKSHIKCNDINVNGCESEHIKETFDTIDSVHALPKVPSINDFQILKVLGKGAYGKVYQVRKINGPGSGQIYAMKAMNKSRICGSKTDVRHTKAERNVLVSVNNDSNPFIVRLHFAFETERRLYLVQEFCCGGELFRRMEFERLMLEKDAIFYLSEIVIALQYLHSKAIVYRDLKTENVMLDKEGHVKLIDFGLSKMGMFDETLTNTFCGTVEYMAPEVILRSGGYGKPADWWSLGIFTFDLLTGRSPFHSNQGKHVTKERILRGKFPTPKILTPEAGDFIRKLLRKQAAKRLGTQGAWEVKEHGFFSGIDWDMVAKKQYKPPFEPQVVNETDVQHFDEQFTSRSPRESNEQPPNAKADNTKNVNIADVSFDDFDYVSDIFREDIVNKADQTNLPIVPSTNCNNIPDINSKSPIQNSSDITTEPVDNCDDGIFTWKNCSKCQHQINPKDNVNIIDDKESNINHLNELRICSHGS